MYLFCLWVLMCVLSSLFSPIPKEGVGIERERGSSEQKWEERMKVSSLKKTDMLFCTTFSSCNMCLLPFYSTSPICLSPALSLSLFLSLTPSLSLFGHSDVRFTASLTGVAGEFPCAVWSLIPPNLSFCSLCALRLKTTRFLHLWLFFKKSSEIFCHFESEIILQ